LGLLHKNKGLDSLYTDKFSIYRAQEVDDGYGGTIFKDTLVSENNPCRLSQKTLSATSQEVNFTSVQEFKLFIPLNVEVLQNDLLIVYRGDIKYTFRSGQPFKYIDLLPHQEVVLQEVVENGD
jgi:hypothetical protein